MAGVLEKGVIQRHEQVGPDIWQMVIQLPRTAGLARPGQFVHIRTNDESMILRRPISIAGTDKENGTVGILYRVVGSGTKRLSQAIKGDVIDSLGPLGTSFSMEGTHIVGIGGGVGIAPILFMAREARPGQMTVVIGGRNEKEVFWKDLFPRTLKKILVTTDDGSFGVRGFSVSVLPELFKQETVDRLCACGPAVMMRTAVQMAGDAGVPAEVSLERRMACGVGTCLGCVCDRADGKGHLKVCRDGPVFDASEVIL
ncbi:MAG: dihydroorotate dehydrogenase electron transfer subunit [Dialister sp.]|nr:dihydroorotate dehydrogenase electron transfer subunit [Dialister sp.]